MIYLIIFFLSFLLLNLSAFFYNSNKKRIGQLIFLIALILPAALAAFRDLTIGTDTGFYVWYGYKDAYRADDYAYYSMKSFLEPGYNVFNYVVTKIFKNFQWLLFFIQWFILSFIAWSVFNLKNYKLLPWAFLTYLMLYYNNSLNMTRQTMAIMICIFSFSYLLKKKYLLSIIIALIAMLFHFTSFIFFAVFPIYYLSNKIKTKFWVIQMVTVIIAGVAVVALDDLITLFIGSGVLTERYGAYTSKSGVFGSNIPISDLFLVVAFFFIYIIFQKYSNLDKTLKNLFSTLFMVSIVLCFAAIKSTFAVRGMYYFSYLSIIMIPLLVTSIDHKKSVKLLKFSLYFLYLLFWTLTVVVANLGHTYPYTSKILNL